MSAKVEVVSQTPLALGEGPHWDDKRQLLYYVDVADGVVYRYDPNTKREDKVHADKNTTFAVPRRDNGDEFVYGSERAIKIFNWNTHQIKTIATLDQDKPENLTKLNDGKCDAAGRLWTGTLHNAKIELIDDIYNFKSNLGSIYSIDSKHVAVERWPEITVSNGLAWSNDNRNLFYVDSFPTGTVNTFDYDLASGEISNRRSALCFKNLGQEFGFPDGMTIDKEGKLWIACCKGSRIIRCDPETGTVLQTVQFPVSLVSSCCFGGPELADLYVTSLRDFLTADQLKAEPLAGSVFKVTGLNVAGTTGIAYSG